MVINYLKTDEKKKAISQALNHELKIFVFSKFCQDCQLLPLLLLDYDHCFFPIEVNLVLLNPHFHDH